MKKMKGWICTVLVLCLFAAMLPVTASASTGGSCGEQLTWSLNDDGVLTISGTGPMEDYDLQERPWDRVRQKVCELVIEEGVTSIGARAFCDLEELYDATIGSSVASIGKEAFRSCMDMTFTFCGNAPEFGEKWLPDGSGYTGGEIWIYYPGDNPTWTSDVMDLEDDTDFDIVWRPYRRNQDPPVLTACNVVKTGKILLDWTYSDGRIRGWEVYRADAEHGQYKLMMRPDYNGYINNSAVAGKTYYYYVVTVALDGTKSDKSNIVRCVCKLPRPVVTISNVASSGKIKLNWDKIDGAKAYQVYRATSEYGAYKLMKTTTNTSYINTSAKAGTAYYYKVVAVHEDPEANSAPSLVKSRTCDLPRPVVTIGNVAKSGKVKLSWDAVDGAVGYQVYRATSKNGAYKLMKTTTNTSYTNTSAEAGKAYYYKVVAVHQKSAANSAYSGVESRTCDLPQLDVSVALSTGKPKVSWKKMDGAVGYKVYRATSKTGTYALVNTTTDSYYKDTNVKSGQTCYYKVVAVCANTAGNSAYSGVVSVKVP